MYIADRSIESLYAREILLIPQTSKFAISLTLKTRTVIECDVTYYPATALTETGKKKKKSMLKIVPCKTSICDQCMSKVLIHLKQNCRGTWTHRLIRLYPQNIRFA